MTGETILASVISLLVWLCSMSLYLADETSAELLFDTSTGIHVDTRIDLRGIMNRMERLEYNDEVQTQLLHKQRANLQELRNVINHQNARLLYQNRLIKAYVKRVISLERKVGSLQNASEKPRVVLREAGTADKPDSVQVKPVSGITESRVKKERIRQARAVSSEPVAFFAEFHGTGQTNIGQNQNIVFPNVLTNLGSGYHSLHGVFIAPQGGVYIFSTSILSGDHGYIDFNIMKNGRRIASAIAAGNNDSTLGQGSVTVVSQLAVGDEVWVSLRYPVGAALHGQDFSSFVGCLVTPI